MQSSSVSFPASSLLGDGSPVPLAPLRFAPTALVLANGVGPERQRPRAGVASSPLALPRGNPGSQARQRAGV